MLWRRLENLNRSPEASIDTMEIFLILKWHFLIFEISKVKFFVDLIKSILREKLLFGERISWIFIFANVLPFDHFEKIYNIFFRVERSPRGRQKSFNSNNPIFMVINLLFSLFIKTKVL